MAFVTDKEELKPGLIIFRRGDLQRRQWYCRVRLPKATRYKTIALKTTDISIARQEAFKCEMKILISLELGAAIFNRPFRDVAKEYVEVQRARAQRGEITMGRVRLIESAVANQFNPYVGNIQIDKIGLDRWEGYPAWRRAFGQGRMTRHGNSRPMTREEQDAAQAEAKAKAAARAAKKYRPRRKQPEQQAEIKPATEWIMVSDATIGWEMKLYRAIMNYAVAKQYAPAHHLIKGMPKLEKMRRDDFTLEEYRRLHTKGRVWVKEASGDKDSWYRKTLYEFILIMANTGMRPMEARNLRWRDISEAKDKNGEEVMVLSVRGKGKARRLVAPKSNVGKFLERLRDIPVNGAIVEHEPGDPVFSAYGNGPMGAEYWRYLASLLDHTGLRYGASGIMRSIYSFRHTYATIRLSEGTDALLLADQMGTSVQMLQENYGHVNTIKHADLVLKGMSDWSPPEDGDTAEGELKGGGAASSGKTEKGSDRRASIAKESAKARVRQTEQPRAKAKSPAQRSHAPGPARRG